MNDLERGIRELLDEEVRSAPPPHEGTGVVRRTRRRQGAVIAGGALAAVALVAASLVGLRAIDGADRSTFGDEPTVTTSLNGITMSHPEGWYVVDPDEAGLNGPSPTPDLPKLILAVAPFDPGELFGCPGMVEGTPHAFLMTVQEEPLALSGDSAALWPVELEPMGVDAAESACYPGWEFLRAGWTAAGRTFEGRVGFAPDVSDDERDALLASFASMTFEPLENGAAAAVLDEGEIGGEAWRLIASRDDAGLVLSLETNDGAAGIGGFVTGSRNLQFGEMVVGSGDGAGLVVFGAVPPGTAEIECPAPAGSRTLDVPDAIDDRFEAFLVFVDVGLEIELHAVDAEGHVIASGRASSQGNDPTETPVPEDAALEDGRHFGFIRAVHPTERTIEFDLAYWLSGEEANQAYQEATGDTGPVPNDHFVVNDNPRLRELGLSPDLRLVLLDWNLCCDTFFEGNLDLFAEAIEEQADVLDGDLVYRGVSQWWITIENGLVTRIEEQYSP